MIAQSAPAIGEGIGGVTPGQRAVAVAVVVVVLGYIVVSNWRSRYAGLPDAQAAQKSAINSAKAAASLTTARFDRGTDMTARAVRETIRRLFEGHEPARTRPREAAGEFATTVAAGLGSIGGTIRHRLGRLGRTAGGGVRWATAPLWRPLARLGALPRTVLAPLAVAIGISLTGGTIFAGAALARLLRRTAGPSVLGALARGAIEGTATAADAAVTFLTAFPILGTVAIQTGTVAFVLAQWLFVHWYLPAALLAIGALALYWLERWTPAIEPDRRRHPLRAAVTTILAVVVIWVVGAGAAVQGAALGYPRVGQVAALVLATVLALFFLAVGVYEYARGLVREARLAAGRDLARVYGYLLARRLWILLSVLFAPLVPAYVVIGLTRVPYDRVSAALTRGVRAGEAAVAGLPAIGSDAVAGAVAAVLVLAVLVRARDRVAAVVPSFEGIHRLVAPLGRALAWAVVVVTPPALAGALVVGVLRTAGVVGLGLLAVLAVLAGAAHLGRAAWPTIKAAASEVLADSALRVVIGAYGFPFVTALSVYIVVYGFVGDGSLLSIAVVGSIAVAAAGLGRALYGFLVAAKYRSSLFAGGGRARAGRVTIEAATLSVDDEEYYYARVNGDTELLREDRDALVAELVDVATALFERGDVEPTLGQHHHENATEYGILDIDETRVKTREAIRKDLYRTLRAGDRLVEREELADRLEDYPAELRERRLEREVALGNLRRSVDVVELRNDPFAQP